jgi:hypothetical protein
MRMWLAGDSRAVRVNYLLNDHCCAGMAVVFVDSYKQAKPLYRDFLCNVLMFALIRAGLLPVSAEGWRPQADHQPAVGSCHLCPVHPGRHIHQLPTAWTHQDGRCLTAKEKTGE